MNEDFMNYIIENKEWADGFTETHVNKICTIIFSHKKIVNILFIILSAISFFFPMFIVTNIYVYSIILYFDMFLIIFCLYKIIEIENKIDYNNEIKSLQQLNLFRDFDLKGEENENNK